MRSQPFEVLQRGATTVYGLIGGLWVMVLFAPPTAGDMLLARPALAAAARRFPGGFPTLTWVLPEAGFQMDAETRRAASTVTREFSAQILGEATVISATGFHAAAVRAVLTALDLMVRASYPKKVFSDLEEAVGFSIRLRSGGEGTAGEITEAIAGAIQGPR
ncbi:MAG: hypothetical protein U0359_11510 [Byssovorax sp.]